MSFVDLLFLENCENVSQILNIYCCGGMFLTQIFASGEAPGTTYFQIVVGGQLHILLGILNMKMFKNH